jgi:hypothetical protein
MSKLPEWWVSIDPGDKNVGLSAWVGPVCVASVHTDPDTCVDWVVREAANRRLKLLVYEAFNLRGELMAQQQGSEFLTSQMIGALRHVCRRAGVPTKSFRPADHKGLMNRNIEFKPPRRPHNEWVSHGHGGHAKDSENLGEYFVRTILLKGRGY